MICPFKKFYQNTLYVDNYKIIAEQFTQRHKLYNFRNKKHAENNVKSNLKGNYKVTRQQRQN